MAARKREIRHFAAKLRVTAVALGAKSHKALDATFRAADPNTAFDLARSYKWFQGRATPRGARLYAEWASLLDTGHDPDWLAACDLEAFLDAVAKRYGIEPEYLLALAGAQIKPEDTDDPAASMLPEGFLCGAYALYVPAQSPHFAGRILRGSLRIAPHDRPGNGLTVTMVQHFAGIRAAFVGPATVMAHGFSTHLNSATGTFGSAFMAFFRPTPPASLLAGIISSFVAVHSGAQPPYAARLLALRVPDAASGPIEESNRYLRMDEDPASDLAALGLPVSAAPDLSQRMTAWLRASRTQAGAHRLSPHDHVELVTRADAVWFAQRAAPTAA
jgi:hypothetical protein